MLPALLLAAAVAQARAAASSDAADAAAARDIAAYTAEARPLAREAVRLRGEADVLAALYPNADDLPALEPRRRALREEARRVDAALRPILRAQSERIYTAGTPMLVRASRDPAREGPRAFSEGFVAESEARAALGKLADSLAVEDDRWREAWVRWVRRRWWRRAALLAAGGAGALLLLAALAHRRYSARPAVEVIDLRRQGR